MKKNIIVMGILTVIIGIAVSLNLHYNCSTFIEFPLSKMKKNDARFWELCITNLSNDAVLRINDNNILYQNKDIFNVKVDKNVYISTPQYRVEIFIDDKIKEKYFLLELEQIEFGMIEKNGFN